MELPEGAPTPSPVAAPRRPLLAFMTWLCVMLFVVWAFGQSVCDLTWYTALCFYIPSPFVAGVLVLQTILLAWRRRVRAAALCATLALFPLCFVLAFENQWAPPAPPTSSPESPPLRLLHWNSWYARRGWEPILDRLRSLHADIYILSEAPREFDVEGSVAALGTGFQVRRFEDMAVFARGEIEVHPRMAIGRHGWSRLIDWESPSGPIRILAVDFPSHPRTHRVPLLAALQEQIQRLQPDLVVGDLNAPRRSPGLRNLPKGYRHAYVAAGSGWSYTWPVFCPIWAIDQCVAGEHVVPRHYELQSTMSSDHRLQLLDFDFKRKEQQDLR